MLPSIALALNVEMLRDGGSLCASFQGANGSEYWLVLPIVFESDNSRCYAQPVIVERRHTLWSVQLSWAHARAILHQVVSLLPSSWDRKYVEAMDDAIRLKGRVELPHLWPRFRLHP
jgi:hypothetical protein